MVTIKINSPEDMCSVVFSHGHLPKAVRKWLLFFSKGLLPWAGISFHILLIAQCPLNTLFVGWTLAAGPWLYSVDYGFWMESLCLIVIECHWAQPLATLSCCGPLKHPSCYQAVSGYPQTGSSPAQPLVGAAVGPAPKRSTVTERPTINEWLTVNDRPLVGGFIQQLVEWWLSCGEWGKRQIPASSPGPSSSPCPGSLGPEWVSWGAPGNSLGAVSCRAPEPSPGPPTGLAQALRSWWTSPQSLSLRPNGSCQLHRISLQDWPPPYWCPEEPEAQLGWAPGFLSSDG